MKLATEGFSVKMTKHRFVHISKPVLYKELSPNCGAEEPYDFEGEEQIC